MRLKMALALSLLLIPSLSWGGAASKLRGVMGKPDPHTLINNIRELSSTGITDTGTETRTGTGIVTVAATCTGDYDTAAVYLVINGTTADSMICTSGSGVMSDTLAYSVSGTYTVRVYGTSGEAADFAANNFYIP